MLISETFQCGHTIERDAYFSAHPMYHEGMLKSALESAKMRLCEACRQQVEAPVQTQLLRDIVADLGENYSHISYRSWCGRNILYVYARDPKSPSGCLVAGSVEDTPATRAVAAELGKRVQQGGLMGEAACRAGMTGRNF